MEYKLFKISENDTKDIKTCLLFNIATARQMGATLIILTFDKTPDAKLIQSLRARLKQIKKNGTVELFLFSNELNSGSPEAEFLYNKYPDLREEKIEDSDISILVKI